MRVLLLADRVLALREHAMLRRLEVGLIDDGLRVVRAQPAGSPPAPTTGLAGALAYSDARWRFGALSPVRALAREILDLDSLMEQSNERPIDVVHVFGERAWALGSALAQEFGADLALEVWSSRARSHVDRQENRWGPLEQAGSRGLWLAPDERVLKALESMRLRWPVRSSRWGVHLPAEPRTPRSPPTPVAMAVLSTGQDPSGLIALLRGLAFAARAHHDILVFVDSAARAARQVWQEAGDLDLMDRLSFVPLMPTARDLVLRTDVFIQSEALGEQHTLVLEAMAQGLCVMARVDPLVEAVSPPSGPAILVSNPGPAGWEEALNRVLGKPDEREAVGRACRAYIGEHRLAHIHVRATLDAYRSFRTDEPIAFSARAESQS